MVNNRRISIWHRLAWHSTNRRNNNNNRTHSITSALINYNNHTTMKTYQTIFLLFALVLSAANAFTMDSRMGSSFVVSQRAMAYDAPRTAAPVRTGVSSLHMGESRPSSVSFPLLSTLPRSFWDPPSSTKSAERVSLFTPLLSLISASGAYINVSYSSVEMTVQPEIFERNLAV